MLKYSLTFLLIIVLIAGAFLLFRNHNGSLIKTNTSAVVLEIKSLNRLETAQFTIEKIIDAGNSGNKLQEVLFGDRILLIAHGEVIAGFDLATISDKNIVVNGNNVTVTLPAPKILVTTLDNDKTRVYDRKTGLLTKGDPNLESQARKIAQTSIQKAACDENILSVATDNGRKQLTSLVKALGFTTVIINIPKGSC